MAATMDFAALYQTLYHDVARIMNQYDGSHDMTHIHRVLKNAREILQHERGRDPDQKYDDKLVFFAALLHDIGDAKYALPGQDITIMVREMILQRVSEPETFRDFASAVQTIASAVSHSSEIKDLQKVREIIAKYPELAVVQDADRLDSIGAAGIGRTFTYSGAHGMAMQASRALFDSKLFLLEKMMKTEAGRIMAEERTQRLRNFAAYWDEETSVTPQFCPFI